LLGICICKFCNCNSNKNEDIDDTKEWVQPNVRWLIKLVGLKPSILVNKNWSWTWLDSGASSEIGIRTILFKKPNLKMGSHFHLFVKLESKSTFLTF